MLEKNSVTVYYQLQKLIVEPKPPMKESECQMPLTLKEAKMSRARFNCSQPTPQSCKTIFVFCSFHFP